MHSVVITGTSGIVKCTNVMSSTAGNGVFFGFFLVFFLDLREVRLIVSIGNRH